MNNNYRLPSNLIDLTRMACWKAFWYKNSLALFLRTNGISQSELNSLVQGETQVSFLSQLFYKLSGMNNRAAHDSILSMARELCKMREFPDLEKQPDAKCRIVEAVGAINKLKPEFEAYVRALKEEEQKESETRQHEAFQQRIAERTNAAKNAEAIIDEHFKRLNELVQHVGEQAYGYELEKWIYEYAKLYDLEARGSYRGSDGHQIDGSITIDGTTLLVEAKLTKDPISRDDITLFANKIANRAENTRGLMVSISGFDEQAKDDASVAHSTIVLMDYSHLFNLLIPRRYTFPELLRLLLRNASQTGSAYLDVRDC